MVHPAAAQCLPQRFGDVILALDLREGARPVPAVERQGRNREIRPGPAGLVRI
jgi:hypothetical protein